MVPYLGTVLAPIHTTITFQVCHGHMVTSITMEKMMWKVASRKLSYRKFKRMKLTQMKWKCRRNLDLLLTTGLASLVTPSIPRSVWSLPRLVVKCMILFCN